MASEFRAAELGDRRLTDRLMRVAEACSAAPDRSFPELMDTHADLEGLYRLLGNKAVSPEAILDAHAQETVARCEELGTVLVVHDTSECAFDNEVEREGLGPLRSSKQGFLLHASLAVAGDSFRRPLGVLSAITWVRKLRRKRSKAKHEDVVKESARWDKAVQATEARLKGRTTAIHLMDREGDAYPLLAAMVRRGDRFVVRAAQDRVVIEDGETLLLRQATALAKDRVEVEIVVSRRSEGLTPAARKTFPPRDRRKAIVCFSAKQLTIRRPKNIPVADLPPEITLNVVHVREPDPPEGAEPIEWFLLTSESIRTKAEIVTVVNHYRARWVIEEFFKALKTGCAYETRQLRTFEGLQVALMIFLPIACRLLFLRSLGRSHPDLPATVALTKTEIEVLRHFSKRVRVGKTPTVRLALLAIAGLGGHLKTNGDPGWITLARGMEKLLSHAEGWTAALRAAGVALEI